VEALTARFTNSNSQGEAALQIGTAGSDRLVSDGSGGMLFGMAGDDVMQATGSGDVLVGGSGNDVLLSSGRFASTLSGGSGTDTAVIALDNPGWDTLVAVTSGTNSWKLVQQYQASDANATVYGTIVNSGNNVLFTAAGGATTTLNSVEWLKLVSNDGNVHSLIDLTANQLQGPAPTLGVSADGLTLTLTFGTTLDATVLPLPTAFVVDTDENRIAVDSVSVQGKVLSLKMSHPLHGGWTQVSYADLSVGNDTQKVLQAADTNGTDIRPFTVTSNTVPATASYVKWVSLSTDHGLANVADGDVINATVMLSAPVAITVPTGSAAPTLTLDITAPDGTVTQVEATLLSPNVSGSRWLNFSAPIGTEVGSVSVHGINLNGSQVVSAYAATDSVPLVPDLSDFSRALLPAPLTLYSNGQQLALNPSVTTGTADDDLVVLGAAGAPVSAALQAGDFSAIGTGAGTRDTVVVNVAIDGVQTDMEAAHYELRYNSGGGKPQVELWHVADGTVAASLVKAYSLPDATHWPAGTEVLTYQPVFTDASGQQQMASTAWLSFTQDTVAYGISGEYLLAGGNTGLTLDVSTTVAVTGGSNHAVVSTDRIQVLGGTGDDLVIGHAGTDFVNGGAGHNTIRTGAGDDLIVIQGGSANTIDGGSDTDIVAIGMAGNSDISTHVGGQVLSFTGGYYSAGHKTETPTQFTLAYNEGSGQLVLTDVAHGNAVSTLSNVEKLAITDTTYGSIDGMGTLLVGTGGADAITANDVDVLIFGGAGNDTLTTHQEWSMLDGGSGDDTFNFDGMSGTQLIGGAGQDKATMTLGTDLTALTLEHVANSLEWRFTDQPGHAVLSIRYDTAHAEFEVEVASASDLGFGNTFNHGDTTVSQLSGVESLTVQALNGHVLAQLTLDEANKSVIPV
jgi:Ca2+-binding RTX toxin-like protein